MLFSIRAFLWARRKAEPVPSVLANLPAYPQVLPLTTAEDRIWIAKAQKDRLSQLETVRGMAKEWATSITAITGVFGIVALIEGPEKVDRLTRGAEIAVTLLVVAAVFLALRSIVLAAVAAQGSPRSFSFSPRGYRAYYEAEVQRASISLRVSRVTVVLAVVALLGAIGLTWIGPEAQKTGTNAFVVSRDGRTVACGELTVAADGFLEVKDSDGKVTRISATDAGAITAAGSCPASK